MDTATATNIFTPQVKPPCTAIVVGPYKRNPYVPPGEACPHCKENRDKHLKWGYYIIHCETCGAWYAPILPF